MIRDWLAGFLGKALLSLRAERRADDDLRLRMDQALDRSRTETSRLEEDGRALAERIRRNARSGRSLLGGGRHG